MRKTTPPEVRFHKKYHRRADNECWPWKRYSTEKYPNFYAYGRNMGAHRYALELKLGRRLVTDELACHTCDNKRCVNPNHLFVGTDLDNSRDMVAKGRKQRGADVFGSKLTDSKVLDIRQRYARGESASSLAKCFGITTENVWHVVSGKTWKHVGGPTGMRSREEVLRSMCGNNSPSAKYSEEQVRQFKSLLKEGHRVHIAAKITGLSANAANHIKNNRTWRHVKV